MIRNIIQSYSISLSLCLQDSKQLTQSAQRENNALECSIHYVKHLLFDVLHSAQKDLFKNHAINVSIKTILKSVHILFVAVNILFLHLLTRQSSTATTHTQITEFQL